MNRLYLNDYINNLQQQIYSSVDKIKQKSSHFENSQEAETHSFSARSQVENHAYQLLPGSVSWSLQNDNSGNAYAAGSYRQAGEVMQEPSVLIDYVFKNNREFDFKV